MKNVSFSVLICAYNEERYIGKLLESIQVQKYKYKLDEIVVVSDSSTDKTNEIVKNFQKKFSNINLIINKKRLGKSLSFNKGKNIINSNFLLSLDADIKLNDTNVFNSLFEKINNEDIWLIGGNPIPIIIDKFNIVESGSFISYKIVNLFKNKINSGDNFYSSHGRILLLKKDLYQNITLLDLPGTDQYMYFFTIKHNKKFIYASSAKVYYFLPQTIGDYLKQNLRFQLASKYMKSIFGKKFVEKQIKVDVKYTFIAVFLCFIRHPFKTICWFLLYFIGKVNKIKTILYSKNKISGKWSISKSTK